MVAGSVRVLSRDSIRRYSRVDCAARRSPIGTPAGGCVMSLGTTRCVTLEGVTGAAIEVEAHLAAAIPAFTIVGLPDAALGEAKDRVRAAISSSGLRWPQRRITVNLVPASLPKAGALFDLAIAVAILAADAHLDVVKAQATVHLGELGLDGRLRPVRGILPAVAAAVRAGFQRVIVPYSNLQEAQLVPGARVAGAETLAQVARVYGADLDAPPLETKPPEQAAGNNEDSALLDLRDVIGQPEAVKALQVAAAGGHHLFMLGAPGAGKTMLARRLPGILPQLTDHEAVEVTSVHSVAGTFQPGAGLITRPPFEDPHHTATAGAIVGGGSRILRPGAVSRAHCGVLFLDEAPEFSPRVLDTLRQPLEQGRVIIHRANSVANFPARFQLVLAATPCPCGKAVGKGLECECAPMARRRYASRLSGPLLDRVDLQVEVHPLTSARMVLEENGAPNSSANVAADVRRARELQQQRWRGTPWSLNSQVPGDELRKRIDRGRVRQLMSYLDTGRISLRGVDRVLRVAWTLADLQDRPHPTDTDVGMALALRTRGRAGGF